MLVKPAAFTVAVTEKPERLAAVGRAVNIRKAFGRKIVVLGIAAAPDRAGQQPASVLQDSRLVHHNAVGDALRLGEVQDLSVGIIADRPPDAASTVIPAAALSPEEMQLPVGRDPETGIVAADIFSRRNYRHECLAVVISVRASVEEQEISVAFSRAACVENYKIMSALTEFNAGDSLKDPRLISVDSVFVVEYRGIGDEFCRQQGIVL